MRNRRKWKKQNSGLMLIGVLIMLLSVASFSENTSPFTDAEQAFIKAHPVVTIGIDPEFMPFEFISQDGTYTGLAKDYIDEIETVSGITFQVVPDITWEQAYTGALKGEIDILPCISRTNERADKFLFSDAYYNFQRVIVVNDQNEAIKSQEDLRNTPIAVQENSSHHSYLSELTDYSIHTYSTVEDALSAVAINQEAAFIGNLATTRHIVNASGISHLKYLSYQSAQKNGLHFAVRKDWPLLQSIINKSLSTISDHKRIAIQTRWIGIEKEVDYSGVFRVLTIVGAILGIVIIVSFYWVYRLRKEIEKRKRIEEDLRIASDEANHANEVKSHFLARMSHEIRTPLNGITGSCYLLESTGLDHKQRAHLERIKQASSTMLGIINDILDFSKVESGKIELDEGPLDLDSVIKNVLNIVSYKIEEKKLDFTLIRGTELPNYFIGDSKRLEQVLMNIINNGIKFTDCGGITLAIHRVEHLDDRYKMEFRISDTGIGISDENIEKLFEAFSQEDSSITRRFDGTGLGLSISQSIVELMGGTIDVYSEIGKGSEFVITLTLQQDLTQQQSISSDVMSFKGLKAIVLDKTGTQLNLVHSYLSTVGINAEMTTSVNQMMTMLIQAEQRGLDPYDLVIVDYDTPKEGLEAFHHRMDENHELSYHPRLLMLLPFLREDLASENDSHHVSITKPIFPSALLDALLHLFDPTKQLKNEIVTRGDKEQVVVAKTPYNVLVVEDNQTNQIIAESLLAEAGISVALANDGAEGVRAYEANKTGYDLILMDLHMPVLNGYEATKAIRIQDTEIPIIALTADAISGVEEKCRAYGFTYFISKPFDPEQFISKVLEILQYAPKEEVNIWDKSLGLKMLGGNEKLFDEVLNIYVIENEHVVDELNAMVAEKSYDEAAKLIHKVKSSTGTIGAESVRVLSSDLQHAFEEGDEVAIESMLNHFSSVFNELIEQVKTRD